MSATKERVATTDAPAAIGPYAQAVTVGGMVYTSGQIALDPATGNVVEGGVAEQTERVVANLRAVLAAAGTGMEKVVKTTVFLRDMKDFGAMNEVYGKAFAPEGVIPPARSTVAVAGLPRDVLVEIECIALI